MIQPSFLQQADQDAATRLQEAFLRELADGSWKHGKALMEALGTTERAIRQMAADSEGQVISGQLGYRLTRFASTEEIDRAEAWLRSQGRAMIRRSLEIRRSRNKQGRAA